MRSVQQLGERGAHGRPQTGAGHGLLPQSRSPSAVSPPSAALLTPPAVGERRPPVHNTSERHRFGEFCTVSSVRGPKRRTDGCAPARRFATVATVLSLGRLADVRSPAMMDCSSVSRLTTSAAVKGCVRSVKSLIGRIRVMSYFRLSLFAILRDVRPDSNTL